MGMIVFLGASCNTLLKFIGIFSVEVGRVFLHVFLVTAVDLAVIVGDGEIIGIGMFCNGR